MGVQSEESGSPIPRSIGKAENMVHDIRCTARMPLKSAGIAALVSVVLCATFAQIACLHRGSTAAEPSAAPRMASRSEFVDLQSGWKIRVVVPMLRSGGYVLPSLQTQGAGNTLELKAGDDLLGYEKAYYKITNRAAGGIRIHFSHAEVWEKGKTHKRNKPLLDLFAETTSARHIRLVYLIRESKADHNMAIVASDDVAALDEVTHAVTRLAECKSSQNASCRWVPNGVAVTPETR